MVGGAGGASDRGTDTPASNEHEAVILMAATAFAEKKKKLIVFGRATKIHNQCDPIS